ncbi:hypothetical protein [Streptomyces sp. NBC_00690]|uniref:hypothetical protein n=1 Tax=Streptomyces sp. NBC_00690 TaxID=2975808 RepID=UPI002E2806E5|nr:hypothetical protein [Streptomyces sp. NBC_00690]
MSSRDEPGGQEQDPKEPLPRDPQDQQATSDHDEDPLAGPALSETEDSEELPETDESGTGPRSGPRNGRIHPEHPIPDEPTG